MTTIATTLLAAGPANATGLTWDSTGMLTSYAFEVALVTDTATLAGTLAFTFGIEDAAVLSAGNTSLLQRTQLPAGWTFNTTTNVVTFTNPAVGRTSAVFVAAAPIKRTRPVWTYGSGGGLFTVSVSAWGATFD